MSEIKFGSVALQPLLTISRRLAGRDVEGSDLVKTVNELDAENATRLSANAANVSCSAICPI